MQVGMLELDEVVGAMLTYKLKVARGSVHNVCASS